MPKDKKDWYAIAEAAKEDEKAEGPAVKGKRAKGSSSSDRAEWYEAAGTAVPQDLVKEAPKKGKARRNAPLEALDPNRESDLLQVSAGREDPPFGKIAVGLVALFVAGVLGWLAVRKPSGPAAEPEIDLPIKNIQRNKIFGFVVTPPEGFRQQVVPEPEFLNGIHGATKQQLFFTNPAGAVDAYYYGELKKDTTLDQYVAVGTDIAGKVSAKPLDVVPDGMKDFPTKGFLIETADKVMLYYASQDKDIFVTVYAMAPKASFEKESETVQAAVRALQVVKPTGPHPDKMFAPR